MTDDEMTMSTAAYLEASLAVVLQEAVLRLLVRRHGLDRAEVQAVMKEALEVFQAGARPGGMQDHAAKRLTIRLGLSLARLFPN